MLISILRRPYVKPKYLRDTYETNPLEKKVREGSIGRLHCLRCSNVGFVA